MILKIYIFPPYAPMVHTIQLQTSVFSREKYDQTEIYRHLLGIGLLIGVQQRCRYDENSL